MMMRKLTKMLLMTGMMAIYPAAMAPAIAEEQAGQTASEETDASGEWHVILGAGFGIETAYEGSDETAYQPLPLVIISWRDIITLGPDSLAVNSPEYGPITGALSLGYNPGRDEDDSDDLDGLGDIDPTAQVGLDVNIALGNLASSAVSFAIALRQDIGEGNGLTVEAGPSLGWSVSERVGVEIEASTIWASSGHMEDYFGISANQSISSGLDAFDADAGVKRLDLSIGAQWQISDHWLAIGGTGLGYLIGDAADSPITEQELQPSIFLALGYAF